MLHQLTELYILKFLRLRKDSSLIKKLGKHPWLARPERGAWPWRRAKLSHKLKAKLEGKSIYQLESIERIDIP